MRLPTTLLKCDVVTVVCTTFDDGEDHSVKHRSRSSHGSYMTSKLDCKLVRTQSLLKKIGNSYKKGKGPTDIAVDLHSSKK